MPSPRPAALPLSLLLHSWDVPPPPAALVQRAAARFTARPATRLFTAPRLLHMPFTGAPEVAFLGRSNVGKSSLLNALLGAPGLCSTSKRPGHTRAMAGYAVGLPVAARATGPGGAAPVALAALDFPGYGYRSQRAWGEELSKYLAARKELRRVFVCVDAGHGVKRSDREMLRLLRRANVAHQVVLTKADRVLFQRSAIDAGRMERMVRKVRKIAQPGVPLRTRGEQGGPTGIAGNGDDEEDEEDDEDEEDEEDDEDDEDLEEDEDDDDDEEEDDEDEDEDEDDGDRGLPAFGQIVATSTRDSRKLKAARRLQLEPRGVMGIAALRWAVLTATGMAPVSARRMATQ